MSLSDFTTVTITSATRTPTRVGFGTPLVLGYFTAWPDRVRTYQTLDAMVADGITSTGIGAATYWSAAAIFSQNPRVKQIKVGRRTNAWTQVVDLTPTSATQGVVYTLAMGPLGGSQVSFQRTVPAASSISAECTALKALINGEWPAGTAATISAFVNPKVTLTGLTGVLPEHVGQYITISGCATSANNGTFVITDYVSATSLKYSNAAGVSPDANSGSIVWSIGVTVTTPGNTKVTVTVNQPGTMYVFSQRNPELTIMDQTAAPSDLSADLDAVRVADDNWYGFVLDSDSKAQTLITAAWTEPQLKINFSQNSDTENGTVGASNTLLKQLKAAAYFRTSTWTNSAVLPAFLGAGIMGEEFPFTPGTGTYLGKTVASVTVDNLSSTFETEVVAQNGNVYTSVLGLNVTRPGKMASGEFIDVVVGRDELASALKEANFGVIAGNRRVPYTNGGVNMFVAATKGVLRRRQGSIQQPGFLDPEVDPIVTAPLVEDVDPSDRAARIYPSLSFSARIAGAIHAIDLTGTISV